MRIVARTSRGRKQDLLTAAGSAGLLLYFADLFMVPGYFDWQMAASLAVCFALGLGIALLAGYKYRKYDEPPGRSLRALLLSPPVLLYLAGVIGFSVAGYLNYVPKPKGH